MRTLIKHNCKILLKNPFLLVVLIGFTAYFGVACIQEYYHFSEPLGALWALLNTGTVLFVFFTFFSYEYLVKANDVHVTETIESLSSGKARLYLGQFVVLLCMVFFFSAVVFGAAATWGITNGMQDAAFYIHAFQNVTLDLFFGNLIGVLLALLCAVYLTRVKSYIVLLIAVFLATPFSDSVLLRLQGITGIGFGIKIYTRILNPDSLSMFDNNYGLPLERFRWSLAAFFISILLLFILWKVWRRRDTAAKVVAAALCAVCLLSSADIVEPGSLLRSDNLLAEEGFYHLEEQMEQSADFSVTGYDMKIAIDKQLSARVSMEIQGGEGKYRFTLYHGMRIGRVTDGEGKPLEFVREGDYLEVVGHNLNRITVEYAGHYPLLYANMQGVWMAANFYYYPVEGYHTVWDENLKSFNKRFSSSEKEFQVSVSGMTSLYSNLGGENGSFSGTAKAASFFSTLFLRTYQVGGNTIYKSGLDIFDAAKFSDLQGALDKYNTRVGANVSLGSGIKIFFTSSPVSNVDRNRVVDMGDHLTVNQTFSADGLALNLLLAKIPDDPVKEMIKQEFGIILSDKNAWIGGMKQMYGLSTKFESSMLQGVRPQDQAMTETRFWMCVKARTMDDEAFFKSVYAYLMDENDHTPELEFIKNLK